MKIHLLLLILLTIITTGCGNEEEEKNDTTKEAIIAETAVAETAVVETAVEEIVATNDLVSAPDFNFITSADLEVTLPPSPSSDINYFISICTDFLEENGEIIINYDSCKLRTSLTSIEQSFILALSTAELTLIAQVWPIQDGAQPINLYWNIEDSGNNWIIAI